MRIQLWSYNYHPEPTAVAPVSRVLAEGLRERGHDVTVVAAHPHYPTPEWGTRLLPYRDRWNGIDVLRLPLWIGRASAGQRIRQEASFLVAQTAATPFLGRPDVLISASPSFPALLPALLNARARRIPWILWLHDILPDGALATGLLDEQSVVVSAARRLERLAYSRADAIVVLSGAFTTNLTAKGVSAGKIRLIYDPATRVPTAEPSFGKARNGRLRLLSIGNIGYSQGLARLVAALERYKSPGTDIELVITGSGVAAPDVAAEISSTRVRMLGVVSSDQLEEELLAADVALVSQYYQGPEFNIPSKLMNFMFYGLPVLAVVHPDGEVARIVRESRGGWVLDSEQPDEFPRKLVELARSPDELAARGERALAFARGTFSPSVFLDAFENQIHDVITDRNILRTPRSRPREGGLDAMDQHGAGAQSTLTAAPASHRASGT